MKSHNFKEVQEEITSTLNYYFLNDIDKWIRFLQRTNLVLENNPSKKMLMNYFLQILKRTPLEKQEACQLKVLLSVKRNSSSIKHARKAIDKIIKNCRKKQSEKNKPGNLTHDKSEIKNYYRALLPLEENFNGHI